MKFSLNSLIYVINYFLLGVAAYILGAFLSTFLHYKLISTPDIRFLSDKFGIEKLPNDTGYQKKTFDIILERNIFNAQKIEIEFQDVSSEEVLEKVEKKEDSEFENSFLSIALAGTMIYSEKNSYAFISKQDRLNEYVIFGLGDCFNPKDLYREEICTKDSVKILQIRDRWVLILYLGEKQTLRMRRALSANESSLDNSLGKKIQDQTLPEIKNKSEFKSSNSKNKLTNSLVNEKDLSNNPNTFQFERIWVDEQLANFEQLLNDARVVPIKKDENSHFMFQFIKKGSIYEKLGLKKNDIILEINGFIVDSVAKALKLLEVLQSDREISLKVERDNKPVNFRYYIN